MTETAEPRTKAQDTVAMTAATMGHDIVATMLAELRTLPDHWSRLNAETQQKAIERMKEKAAEMVRKSIGFMLTSEFAAVSAKLESVSRRKGIAAHLTVATNAQFRHALYDATGQHVLVVIADPAQWLQRMDEIKARGDQLDLFDPDSNYDPERDQPGYRRDRDPLAPGKSWDQLKADLMGGTPAPNPDAIKEPGAPPPAAETSPAVDTSSESLTPEQEHQATLRELLDRLTGHGVVVSLGELQSRSDADILAVTLWLNWYESEGINVPYLERPAFIPEPPHKGKK